MLICRFQPLQELSEEDQDTVKRFNQQLQTAFNVKFTKGSNPDLQLMQHLWEPLRVVHKPLMLHVVSEMSTFCTHLLLQVCEIHTRVQLPQHGILLAHPGGLNRAM